MTTPGSHGPGEQPPSGGSGWGPPAGSSQPGSPQSGGSQPGSVPPPPPGQHPAPQGQFPQSQYPPPQGQQFPQGHGQQFPQGQGQQFPQGQGQQFPQGQGQQFPQGQAWPPQQSSSKGGAGKWVAIAGGILALVVIGILAFAFLAGGDPEAGDCLEEEAQELTVVDCDDSAAEYKLLGIQEGEQSFDEYQADPETCSAFPEAVQSFWIGENGDETGQGVVYCLTTP